MGFDNGKVEVREAFGFEVIREFFLPGVEEGRKLKLFNVYDSILIDFPQFLGI